MNAIPKPIDNHTLEILGTVERNKQISQRSLSRQLGVALGLANSYINRCVRKGWVKVQHAPANRYLYYLTSAGFAEKTRLTAEYLSTSFSFYREASDSCALLLDQCLANQWQRLLLCGVSDLAEIATLRAMETGALIVGFYDPTSERQRFLGKPVWRDFSQAEQHDARILTEVNRTHELHAKITGLKDQIPLLAPAILRLEPNKG